MISRCNAVEAAQVHADRYPVEQVARHVRTRFQTGFSRLTMRMLPDLDDVAYEASDEGLRILGATELALEIPGADAASCQDHVSEPGRIALDVRLDRGGHVAGRAVRHVTVGPADMPGWRGSAGIEECRLDEENERFPVHAAPMRQPFRVGDTPEVPRQVEFEPQACGN